ncbi:site-2 protease family protein [Alicyclobacillus fodiniaquatilis]|uniref:Site-2 protease family protein n=1 Tax=Alicyclobacillus fodiniaquatilis TaxID=1661150 RepID=A0ABW4JI50_9BACL
MSIVLTVIVLIVMFSLIVGVHEFGHLLFARLFRVPVYQYSIGMGPVIKKWRRGETHFALRWLLIGGFVHLAGTIPLFMKGKPVFAAIENGRCIRFVGRKGSIRRVWAGEIVKVVPAVILPDAIRDKNGKVYIFRSDAKMVIGDSFYPLEKTGNRLIDKPVWQQVIVFVAGATFNFILAYILIVIIAFFTQTRGIGYDFLVSLKIVIEILKATLVAVCHIITPHGINKQLGGTVYLIGEVHQQIRAGLPNTLEMLTIFTAFMSLSIGLMNLLPVPPLDGFLVIRVSVDRITGWSYVVLNSLTMLGTLALLTLSVVVNARTLLEMIH